MMRKDKLLDEPIQIETPHICNKHQSCKDSQKLTTAINDLIVGLPRHIVALTLSDMLVRLFVQDSQQQFDGRIDPEYMRAGIEHYVNQNWEFLVHSELEAFDAKGAKLNG
jgi:hypothetical protein